MVWMRHRLIPPTGALRYCVGQDCRLFYGTLRHNIVIGNPGVSTEEFLRVVRLTGLDHVAARHPLVLTCLSAKWAIAFPVDKTARRLARCLLLRPKILLMDEPTSSMDAMTETLFLRRLKEATQGQTLVIVTHRMSVLSPVERLIVMEDGHVVKDGPKDQVMASLNENVMKKSKQCIQSKRSNRNKV